LRAADKHAPEVSPRQRSILFREVNDRIHELLESTDPALPGEFLCECGADCDRRVELMPAEFAELRENGEDVRSPNCLESSLPRAVAPVASLG
jgi:hypothetical protein